MSLFYKLFTGLLLLFGINVVIAEDSSIESASLAAMQGSWGYAPGALPAFVINNKDLQEGSGLNRTVNSLDFKNNNLIGTALVDKDLHETCVVSFKMQAENLIFKKISCKRLPVNPNKEVKLFKVKPFKKLNFDKFNCATLQIELDKNYDYFSDTCIREIKSGKNKPYLLKVPNISQEKYQQASRFVSLIDAMYQKQCTIENEAKFETIFVCGR